MPVTIDLMENEVIRDYFLQGERQGARGEAMSLLTRQLEHRFGPLTEEATRKLAKRISLLWRTGVCACWTPVPWKKF